MAIFNNVEPLKMWVHKILPLVYDDSMSYYETLCKVVQKLNEVVKLSNEQTEYLNTWLASTEESLTAWKTDTRDELEGKINDDLGAAIERLESEFADELLDAEGMIYGTQDDVPVEEGSEYYQNNAKYFKEQASEAAIISRNYANGGSTPPPPLWAQNNSKYFRERAEAWAVGKVNSTNVPESDETHENNAKYYAEQAREAALTFVPDPTLSEAGRPAEAKATGDAIAELKSAVSVIQNQNKVLTAAEMKTGYYRHYNGTYDTWLKTLCSDGYILVATESKLLVEATTETADRYVQLLEYDSNDAFITYYGGINPGSTQVSVTQHVQAVIPVGHKIKINLGFWSNSNASDSNTDAYLSANFTIKYGYIPIVDDTLTRHGCAADSKIVGDKIKAISSNPTKLNVAWENGTYRTTTGGAKPSTEDPDKKRSIYQVPFHDYLKIDVPENYKLQWYRYTGWTYTTFTNASEWLTGTVIINDDNALYKLSIATIDGSNFPAVMPEITIITGNAYNYLENSVNVDASSRAILTSYDNMYIPSGVYTFAYGLTLRDNTKIYGDGFSSILYFPESIGEMSALTCGNANIITNLQIKGRETDYGLAEGDNQVPSTNGGRHGIKITGTKLRGVIQNVWIHGFSGRAIYAYLNSYSSNQGWDINNCYCTGNHCGIYTRRAEFFRISNCDCNNNYMGMFLGGGNNAIANSNFSSNMYGINMDNSDDTSSNNTHGSVVGCILQHNRLAAIYINNMASGEIFSACNIDPNDNTGYAVQAISAHRIVFNACNFMEYSAIDITAGGLIMFIGCNFREYTVSHYTSTSNRVKFVNCYDNSGMLVDPTGA